MSGRIFVHLVANVNVFFFFYEMILFSTEINNFTTFDIFCLSAFFFSIHLTTTYCLVYRSDINNEIILHHPYSPAHWHHTRAYKAHILSLADAFMYTFNTAQHTYKHTHKHTNVRSHIGCAHLAASISTHLVHVSALIRWEDGFPFQMRVIGVPNIDWHWCTQGGGFNWIVLIEEA